MNILSGSTWGAWYDNPASDGNTGIRDSGTLFVEEEDVAPSTPTTPFFEALSNLNATLLVGHVRICWEEAAYRVVHCCSNMNSVDWSSKSPYSQGWLRFLAVLASFVAACCSIQYLFQCLVRRHERLQRLPPVGASFTDFSKHVQAGDLAYWLWNTVLSSSLLPVVEIRPAFSFRRWLKGNERRFYVVGDTVTARRILQDGHTDDDNVIGSHNRKKRHSMWSQYGWNSTTTSSSWTHPHRWGQVRRCTVQAMEPPPLQLQQLDQAVQAWMESTLKPAVQNEQPIEVLLELQKLVLHLILLQTMLFDWSESKRDELLQCLETCQRDFGRTASGAGVPLTQTDWMAWILANARMQQPGQHQASHKLLLLCHELWIEQKNRKKTKNAKDKLPNNRNKDDAPESLLELMEQSVEYDREEQAVYDVIAIFASSVHPTAASVAFCLQELASHRRFQVYLRAALQRDQQQQMNQPENAQPEKNQTGRSSSSLLSLPILQNCVRETLRLHPPYANGTVFTLARDISVVSTEEGPAGDKVIPSGSVVLISHYAIQRQESVFSSSNNRTAHQFQPQRWEQATNAMLGSYLPFSLGARHCPGQPSASRIMELILARVLSEYEFRIATAGTTECTLFHQPVGLTLSVHSLSNMRGDKTTDRGAESQDCVIS